jgi:hypothetical protein
VKLHDVVAKVVKFQPAWFASIPRHCKAVCRGEVSSVE